MKSTHTRVRAVPGKPDEVLVETLNGNSILASYSPPLTDGGSPIHSYKVWGVMFLYFLVTCCVALCFAGKRAYRVLLLVMLCRSMFVPYILEHSVCILTGRCVDDNIRSLNGTRILAQGRSSQSLLMCISVPMRFKRLPPQCLM